MGKVWIVFSGLSVAILLVVNPALALPAMLTGANDALKLTISLVAVYALWIGIMEILDATGLSERLASLMRPFVKLLFPDISDEAARYVSLNFSVNILGAGGAATPLGIKAVSLMDDLSGTATSSMILFAVINSSSLQLIPTTVIGLRSAAGSTSPADIVLIGIAAQTIALIAGIFLCKLFACLPKRKISPTNTSCPRHSNPMWQSTTRPTKNKIRGSHEI